MNELDPDPDPGKEPPDKRSTRTKRREENQNTSEYVIKSSFVNSLKNKNSLHIQLVKDNINKRVIETSKGTLRLSLSLNLMLRDLMNKTNPLEITLPPFLSSNDITFANHLMLGIENARTVDPFVVKFLEKRGHLLPEVPIRLKGDTNTMTRAAEQYLTNYRTYIETVFESKQKSFLFLWCQKHGIVEDTNLIRNLINGWPTRKMYVQSHSVTKLINYQRQLLKLSDKISVNSIWIKKNYETVIVYYKVLSDYLIKNGKSGNNTNLFAQK